jgi:hypothetical protein
MYNAKLYTMCVAMFSEDKADISIKIKLIIIINKNKQIHIGKYGKYSAKNWADLKIFDI